MPLTAKQQRFVEEYLIDLNATQAAIRAGYSEKTARQIATKLLSKVYIQEAVNAGKLLRSQKTEIDAAWVLKKAAGLFEKCEREGDTFNPSAAVAALNLVARHQAVNALADKSLDAKVSGEFIFRWQNDRDSDPL